MKTKFTFVFKDFAFEDGLDQPYIVDVYTHEKMDGMVLSDKIREVVREVQDRKDISTSEQGIGEVLSRISEVSKYVILKHDNVFTFGYE